MKTGLGLFFIGLFALAAIGWCMNVYKLAVVCDFESPYKCEAVRVVGIIPPIGAIVGYIDLGK